MYISPWIAYFIKTNIPQAGEKNYGTNNKRKFPENYLINCFITVYKTLKKLLIFRFKGLVALKNRLNLPQN